MAKSYRPVDRGQQFLLPPDMREWLPAEHVVWLVLQVIEQIDTSGFHRRRVRRSTSRSVAGQRGYDPDMLLGLLVYAYCVGERSSRQIERRCRTDVAFRVACAQDTPDHTVIARFRSEFADQFADLFSQVLMVCARAGMVRVGTVAVDGTKIEANASMDANKSEARLREMAEQMVREAAAVDETEDRADEDDQDVDLQVRQKLGSRDGRADLVAAALASIEDERQERPGVRMQQALRRVERAVKREAQASAGFHRYQQRVAAGERPTGRRPKPLEQNQTVIRARQNLQNAQQSLADRAAKEPVKRRNLTDLESRIMKTRQGFRQTYNAQIVASEDHLIVAADATNSPLDMDLYQPTVAAAQAELDRLAAAGQDREINEVLADAGYFSTNNLTAQGPDRLIAPGKGRDLTKPREPVEPATESGRDREAIEAMRERFKSPEVLAAYRRRGALVEPVNRHLKDRRGLRRFSLRGLAKVNGELKLAAAATNLLRYGTVNGLATA